MCIEIEVTIPASESGNYYLIANIDALNTVYEHTGEMNNTTLRVIEVSTPLPSDLVIQDITVPLQATAGEVIEISWSTRNIGTNPAYGALREVIYLSADTLWSTEDAVFGVKDTSAYIPPLSIVGNTFTEQAGDVIEGEYYAIVRTDVQQQVIETDDTNNTGISFDRIDMDVMDLIIDSLTLDTLFGNLALYYKIEVSPGFEGESMVISLQGDSVTGKNELYAKFEGVPTRGDFDFGPQQAAGAFQHVIIPSLETGTYYITAYGYTQSGDPQDVALLARIFPFDILSISPNKGVRDKKVTVEIKGVKLDQTERFRLRNSQPWYEHLAESVYVFNENLVYATFDLTDVPVDTYKIDGIKSNNALAVAPQDFIVVAEGITELQYDAFGAGIYPNVPTPSKIIITFLNSGDVDIEGAVIEVDAPYGNRIAPTLQELKSGGGSAVIEILLSEPNGPPGIIRPGAAGTIEVFVMSTPGPSFTVSLKD
jgi:hypothetical protein